MSLTHKLHVSLSLFSLAQIFLFDRPTELITYKWKFLDDKPVGCPVATPPINDSHFFTNVVNISS